MSDITETTIETQDGKLVKINIPKEMFLLNKTCEPCNLNLDCFCLRAEYYDDIDEEEDDSDMWDWYATFCFYVNGMPVVAYRDEKGQYSFRKASLDKIEEAKGVEPEPIRCDMFEAFKSDVSEDYLMYWSNYFTATAR